MARDPALDDRGCLAWRREGLKVPKVVRDATDEYFADQDALGEWLEAQTVAQHDRFTLTKHLFGSWRQWCEPRNLPLGTETAFADHVKERGFEKKRREHGRGFVGIRLKSASEMET
jgi:putative DNA primase/helicase